MNKGDSSKSIFSTEDFEQMGWHDCKIHAVAFNENKFKLSFDIDYILKWENHHKYFKFWVAPATFIFENVFNLNFILEESSLNIYIDNITRENPKSIINSEGIVILEYDWIIELGSGEINFNSTGYKLFIRNPPIGQKAQELDLDKRGGIGFGNY